MDVNEFDPSTTVWFDRPADHWLEALPLGNGRTGAMCFATIGGDRLQINDETAWSGSAESQCRNLPDAAASRQALAAARHALSEADYVAAGRAVQRLQHDYTQSYLPFVDCQLDLTIGGQPVASGDDRVTEYSRSLDLATGCAEHRYRIDGFSIVHQTFLSARQNLIVSHITSSHPLPMGVTARLTTQLSLLHSSSDGTHTALQVRLPSDVAPKHEEVPDPIRWDSALASVAGAALVRIDSSPLSAVVLIGTATTYRGPTRHLEGDAASCLEELTSRVESANSLGIDRLWSDHLEDHSSLFERVRLELPEGSGSTMTTDRRLAWGAWRQDPSLLALLYHFGRYCLMASSLPGSRLPATLQGIWNDQLRPSWSSNYTLNINTEMNYWAAESTNLPECHLVLLNFVHDVADLGTLAARHSYGVDGGWVCHHNSDGWAYPWPTGGGVADPCWANWPSAGYWLVQHLWEHFRFTRDRQRLNHDWPTIRGAVEFAQHFTRIDSDGWLDTSPSTSPENSFVTPEGSIAAVERASTMDLELLRELFLLVGLAATELGLSDDPIVTWAADSLSRIRPLRIDDMGRIEEWSQDFGEPEPRHRHLSHLWGFFPGSRSRQDGFSSAVAASLDGRGADSTGWSLAWKLALRARIGDAGAISELLDFITRPVLPDGESSDRPWSGGLYPNLFSAHPPFQIDGNLGFTGAFTEALLQSHGDEILLLPALPPELPTGSVRGLVARGRVHVDLKWAGGRLSYAALTSIDCDQSVTIRYAGHVKRAHLVAGKNTRLNF